MPFSLLFSKDSSITDNLATGLVNSSKFFLLFACFLTNKENITF